MKTVTKKALLSTVILTMAFSLLLVVGPKQKIAGVVLMGLAMVASAVIWATGSVDSDDHHGKH